jgi:hypothetical protein
MSLQMIFGAALIALYVTFLTWHSQRGRKLTLAEIDHYLSIIEKLPSPAKDIKAVSARIRAWAEADDGKPVYMFNLIHFFSQVRTFAGAPDFKGTPEEANARYEKAIRWLWLSHAAYPIFVGAAQGRNLINMQPEREWGRLAVIRYPNRRTFFKLLSDPGYAPMEPYKFMALEIDLVPVSGDLMIPDLRWLIGGGFIIIFLLVGWIQAAVLSGQ